MRDAGHGVTASEVAERFDMRPPACARIVGGLHGDGRQDRRCNRQSSAHCASASRLSPSTNESAIEYRRMSRVWTLAVVVLLGMHLCGHAGGLQLVVDVLLDLFGGLIGIAINHGPKQ